MNRALNILKAAALATVPIVGAAVCVLLLQISSVVDRSGHEFGSIAIQANKILVQLQDSTLPEVATTLRTTSNTVNSLHRPIGELTRSLQRVNAPCAPGPCGTLADVNKTLNTARGTMGQVELAALHENRYLDNLNSQVATTFTDAHNVLQNADLFFGAARQPANDLHTLLVSPDVTQTMHNVSGMTATGNHMLFTFDQVETKATHNYLHPSKNPFVRTWNVFQPFMLPTLQIGGAVAAGMK